MVKAPEYEDVIFPKLVTQKWGRYRKNIYPKEIAKIENFTEFHDSVLMEMVTGHWKIWEF